MNNVSSKKFLPLVSIVIPTYNHSKYLVDSIKSVKAQDYPNIELIVLDDGSTDNTPDVLAQLDNNFLWERQANMGQSQTLTKGWKMSKGDILGYLSADDMLLSNAVSTSVTTLMTSSDVVATYCNFNLIDPYSHIIKEINLPEFDYKKMLGEVNCPIGPGAFFKRSTYLSSGPWNSKYKQMPDYDFWLRLGLLGKFVRLPEVLASYRVHEESQSYSITSLERSIEPILIVSSLLNQQHKSYFDREFKEHALANANLVSAQLNLRAGRYGQGFILLKQALKHSSFSIIKLNTVKLIFNAIFNRSGHKFFWKLRKILKG